MYRSTQEEAQQPGPQRPGASVASAFQDDTSDGPTVASPPDTMCTRHGHTGITSKTVTRWLRREVRRDEASRGVPTGRAGRDALASPGGVQ